MSIQRDPLNDMVSLGININEYLELKRKLEAEGKNMNDHFKERDAAMKREIEELKNCIHRLRQTVEEMIERGCDYGEAE